MLTFIVSLIAFVVAMCNAGYDNIGYGGGSSYSSVSLGENRNLGYQGKTIYSIAPIAAAYEDNGYNSGSSYASVGQSGYQQSGLGLGYNKITYASPVLSAPASIGHGYGQKDIDYYTYPKYQFNYGVEDKHTNDYHNQEEVRDGDVVKGQYSLHEADGTIRTVQYVADKNGFNANVVRSGHASHPQVQVAAYNQKYNSQYK